MGRPVPILITWDVDTCSRDPNKKRFTMQTAIELCRELGIRSTFLFVAQEAEYYPEEIAELKRACHEIGCHGLTHGNEEEYNRMPPDMQRDYIERATRLLEEKTGTPITAFRGPRVKTSSVTLELLSEYGYLTDSSVCSRRLDLLSSNLVNVGWLTAPRSPYHPHKQSAYRRGDLDILEVPVSAFMLPFISSTLFVVRLPIMRALCRLLYAEAKRTGRPIVYLGHPAEFKLQQRAHRFRWSDLSPRTLRTHGLLFRKGLSVVDREARLDMSRRFLSYLGTLPDVRFMTMHEYALYSDNLTPKGTWAD